jgi:hypothetical protein
MAEKKKKDDRCTRIAKRKYDVWPSAYASGAVVQCRKGKIWKGLKEQELNDLITRIVTDSLSQLAEKTDYSKEKESGLHGWFSRQGGKGSSSGWVDCNTCRTDKKTGRKKCKACGREKGEKRSKYPSCRPTPSACGTKGKGEKWGKKSESKMKINKEELKEIILQEVLTALSKERSLEESVAYHLNAEVGFDKNIHRPGSTMFFALFREARRLYREGSYKPTNSDEVELLEGSDIGEFAYFEGGLVPLDYPIEYGNEEHLSEAEYKGKKVELNKPKRGEGGRAYVFVNSGKKTKDGKIKVKKVSFGSSMPDAMGDSPAARKRRKNFGDRHNCSEKTDKTTPGYWSCRATKFFGRDISGWW